MISLVQKQDNLRPRHSVDVDFIAQSEVAKRLVLDSVLLSDSSSDDFALLE